MLKRAIRRKWLTVAACSVLLPGVAVAQTKIDPDLEVAAQSGDIMKVLIITRPDPAQPDGGAALTAPSGYVSARLGDAAQNISAIGDLPVASAEINQRGLELLRVDPNVALVVEDVPVPPVLYDTVAMTGADRLHAAAIKGNQVSVAVLDTGIESGHAAFQDAIAAEACFSTPASNIYNLRSLCPNRLELSLLPGAAGGCPADVEGCDHGTHVAGIVAGHGMAFEGKNFGGIAPAANVVAVQVFTLFEDDDACGAAGRCILSFTSDQLRALEWVFDRRTDYRIAAVNMSLGGGKAKEYCDNSSALTQMIERLKAEGILTVIAAGNSRYHDAVAEPACISAAVSVSAIKKDGLSPWNIPTWPHWSISQLPAPI